MHGELCNVYSGMLADWLRDGQKCTLVHMSCNQRASVLLSSRYPRRKVLGNPRSKSDATAAVSCCFYSRSRELSRMPSEVAAVC